MMKIVLIALFFTAAFAQLNCNGTTCAKAAGDACGASALCDYGLTCDFTTSTCKVAPALGEECTLGQICQQGTCTGGECRLTTTAGHACTEDTDCTFQNGTSTASTCVNGVCFGLGVDAPCGFGQCNAGLYCNAFFGGTCVPQLTQDGDCSASGLSFFACAAGFSCAAGVCKEAISGAVDAACTSNLDCAEGNYCSLSAKTCKASFTGSAKACDASADCATDENCVCNKVPGGTGVCRAPAANPTGYRAAYLNYQRCIYNASASCNQFIPTGCPACQTQYCALVPFTFPNGLGDCGYSAAAKTLVNSCLPTVPPTVAPTVPPTPAPATAGKSTTTTATGGGGGSNNGAVTTTSGAISVAASIAMVVLAMLSLLF